MTRAGVRHTVLGLFFTILSNTEARAWGRSPGGTPLTQGWSVDTPEC